MRSRLEIRMCSRPTWSRWEWNTRLPFGRIVSGQLPVSVIPAAARLTSLRFARSAVAVTSAGAVTTQGDIAMRSDIARANLGVNGAGITVGVLSDSFNCLGGAPSDVTNGD